MSVSIVVTNPKNSQVSKRFRDCFEKLPINYQKKTMEKYLRWKQSPMSVRFEPKFADIYAVEISRSVHAVCKVSHKQVLWLWIGTYDDYEKALRQLRNAYKFEE
jgi:hypothetical protein